jgi:hypothetical protein
MRPCENPPDWGIVAFMGRADHGSGGVGVRRALCVALAALAAGLVLSATVRAASKGRVAVAVAVGKPIARAEFSHWLLIAAKAEGKPLIVPDDPPRFAHCIAQARAGIPSLRHDATQALRQDCRALFTELSDQVLDFLIRADWQEAEAAKDGIVITAEQVDHAFVAAKQMQFSTPAQFDSFLQRTGQTVADVKARVRDNLVFSAVKKAEHLSETALETELTHEFKSQTTCARFYVMSDCARG